MTIEITDIEDIYIDLTFLLDPYVFYLPAVPYYTTEGSGQDASYTSALTNQDNSAPVEIVGQAQQWSNPQNQDHAF